MEAVIFIGIQATGKSTFYKEHFFHTHVRINLDMLRTRHRERILVNSCLEAKQSFVIDNTNPTKEDRHRYLLPARDSGFLVKGYYFQSKVKDAIKRNEIREFGRIPEKGILNTYGRLEMPALEEGFDELLYVTMAPDHSFTISPWRDEI